MCSALEYDYPLFFVVLCFLFYVSSLIYLYLIVTVDTGKLSLDLHVLNFMYYESF
jgi:hypothetical protein